MGFVSVVVPFTDRWYFAGILAGATVRIERAGHRVALHVVPPSPTAAIEAADAIERDFAEPECIGAIATGIKYRPGQGQKSRSAAGDRPLVVVGGSALGFPTVMIDDIGAARMATEHLLGLGHTRVAHLAGRLDDQMDFSVHGRRAKGYRQVMESALLEPSVVEADFDPVEAKAVALRLLDSPDRPTAVFAVSDEIAFAVLAAARELGLRVGADLSVVGVDDHPQAAIEDLTTVRQVPTDMGTSGAEMLLSGLRHGPDPKQSRLAPITLVKRGSSGRVRVPV